MDAVVSHDPENSRYVLTRDGDLLGRAEYLIDGDTITFTHTEVDPDRRERGLASRLVQFALDDVRTASARRVVAQCPYVRKWIGEHPEYQDLLER